MGGPGRIDAETVRQLRLGSGRSLVRRNEAETSAGILNLLSIPSASSLCFLSSAASLLLLLLCFCCFFSEARSQGATALNGCCGLGPGCPCRGHPKTWMFSVSLHGLDSRRPPEWATRTQTATRQPRATLHADPGNPDPARNPPTESDSSFRSRQPGPRSPTRYRERRFIPIQVIRTQTATR